MDGRVLVIDRTSGLQSITDANGNKLTIGRNGITHSDGRNVTFVRDTSGRITKITDAAATGSITYAYAPTGDLASVTDQVGSMTKFGYNGSHGLVTITDPRGLTPARNEYETAGG
jgi:YD repeat-containing protein